LVAELGAGRSKRARSHACWSAGESWKRGNCISREAT
jgi:hypothetical protein